MTPAKGRKVGKPDRRKGKTPRTTRRRADKLAVALRPIMSAEETRALGFKTQDGVVHDGIRRYPGEFVAIAGTLPVDHDADALVEKAMAKHAEGRVKRKLGSLIESTEVIRTTAGGSTITAIHLTPEAQAGLTVGDPVLDAMRRADVELKALRTAEGPSYLERQIARLGEENARLREKLAKLLAAAKTAGACDEHADNCCRLWCGRCQRGDVAEVRLASAIATAEAP